MIVTVYWTKGSYSIPAEGIFKNLPKTKEISTNQSSLDLTQKLKLNLQLNILMVIIERFSD